MSDLTLLWLSCVLGSGIDLIIRIHVTLAAHAQHAPFPCRSRRYLKYIVCFSVFTQQMHKIVNAFIFICMCMYMYACVIYIKKYTY